MATIGILRYFWIYHLSIKASGTIFAKMLGTVLHAPLQWIDTVPQGRIVNRFTADLSIVDERLPLSWIMFIASLLRLAGICALLVHLRLSLSPDGDSAHSRGMYWVAIPHCEPTSQAPGKHRQIASVRPVQYDAGGNLNHSRV